MLLGFPSAACHANVSKPVYLVSVDVRRGLVSAASRPIQESFFRQTMDNWSAPRQGTSGRPQDEDADRAVVPRVIPRAGAIDFTARMVTRFVRFSTSTTRRTIRVFE